MVLKGAISSQMEEHVLLKLFSSSLVERGKPEKLMGMLKAVLNLAAEDELKILDLDLGSGLQVTQGNIMLDIRHWWSERQAPGSVRAHDKLKYSRKV